MEGLVKLDRIDINILVELQKDGRMTNVSGRCRRTFREPLPATRQTPGVGRLHFQLQGAP